MLGSKLRSWMEAVRPKKKQQRNKDKLAKPNLANSGVTVVSNSNFIYSSQSSDNGTLEDVNGTLNQTKSSHVPRYSGANLSSPESAYSTGYSTDGTSPGAPPEYYINIRTGTRYFPSVENEKQTPQISNYTAVYSKNDISQKVLSVPNGTGTIPSRENDHVTVHFDNNQVTPEKRVKPYEKHKNSLPCQTTEIQDRNHLATGITGVRLPEKVNSGNNSVLASPRQRNRIRTNPWVPTNNLSPGNSCVGLHVRQEYSKPSQKNKPIPAWCLSPAVSHSPRHCSANRRESLSSSSCSSNSIASINWDCNLISRSPRINSDSDEEDCTLNEMMGKYDESYVYEKETDILSDSDPTDCDTDIDTGQDGGDEDDPLDHELDYIDNESYLDFNSEKEFTNTGHCIYYNYEVLRKMSRRRTTRRSSSKQDASGNPKSAEKRSRKSSSSRRSRSNSNKYQQRPPINIPSQINGSRSAGTTPLSTRRTKQQFFTKQTLDEHLKRRSNSISFCLPTTQHAIDQRDKEADKKYKELIVEAEHILMSMKTIGLSPRRLPGPPNKRVELLRNAESIAKPESFSKNRLVEDTSNIHLARIPSNNFNAARFSPKKNHITNFINSNSPVLIPKNSPVISRKDKLQPCLKTNLGSPLMRSKYHVKHIYCESKTSPKQKRKSSGKTNKYMKQSVDFNLTSESDGDSNDHHARSSVSDFCCPQSEPVKRKVYNNQSKAVAFNLNDSRIDNYTSDTHHVVNDDENKNDENMRQQALLSTIASLKRSLEDQSESLRLVYTSSQNVAI